MDSLTAMEVTSRSLGAVPTLNSAYSLILTSYSGSILTSAGSVHDIRSSSGI